MDSYQTPPMTGELSEQDKKGLKLAIEQASTGLSEEGVPIGAALIDNATGKVLGVGRNRRVQKNSATLHGETDCLENGVGRLPGIAYKNTTMYTTLSPCQMCSGSILLYGIPRVVIGENETYLSRGETFLKHEGVELVNADSSECKALMGEFIRRWPSVWNEDIGVVDSEAKEQ